MRRHREEVERPQVRQPIAAVREGREITRECGRVTGDIDDDARIPRGDALNDLTTGALAGRVEDDDVSRRLRSMQEPVHAIAHDCHVTVEPLPAAPDGLHWRTRMRFAVNAAGRAGLRHWRSHVIEPIDDCLIAVPAARVPDLIAREWPAGAEVTLDVSSTGERALAIGIRDETITEHAVGRDWLVPVGGFWQVHVGAADVLAEAVLDFAAPRADDGCLDLYSGVGLLAGALSTRTVAVTGMKIAGPSRLLKWRRVVSTVVIF